MSVTSVRSAPPPALGVGSDVDPLLAVLVHRPGPEVAAVAEADPERALFASAPDPEGVRRAHDVLTATLRDHGVEVLLLEDLLRDVHGAAFARDAAPALASLPNLMYVRDTSVWVGACAVPATMREPVRRGEGPLLDAVYRRHPRFAGATVRAPSRSPVEGGDVLPVGDGRVMVGISERTGVAGALLLTTWLLVHAGIDEVITLELPAGAAFHLDLVLSMVDHHTYAVWAPVRDRVRAHRWHVCRDGFVSGALVDDPWHGLRVLEIPGEDARDHGRPRDHGTNLLAIAPGTVVAYADDARANERLRRAGVEVLEVPAGDLAAGRGGPRCLTCPVARASAPR
ncbi:MAG TPA: arginine deiminase family protein [Baekduia sp.]|uniref:arginine deiminase family protein n=1 Tax=Baekduia sp. TaxID=2600305 RepID=UPI002D78737D|nr:arginine deiminase family protein [Baekduia sp.]HET6505425.1 arginine deiminase family protein [Baekduia sp.]